MIKIKKCYSKNWFIIDSFIVIILFFWSAIIIQSWNLKDALLLISPILSSSGIIYSIYKTNTISLQRENKLFFLKEKTSSFIKMLGPILGEIKSNLLIFGNIKEIELYKNKYNILNELNELRLYEKNIYEIQDNIKLKDYIYLIKEYRNNLGAEFIDENSILELFYSNDGKLDPSISKRLKEKISVIGR